MDTVSIIVPCLNEEKTIGLLLEAVRNQTYSLSLLEVIIADGMSGDRTREVIAEFQAAHPQLLIRVVDNPKINIPSALNLALRAAGNEVIVRLDAHSIPNPDYVERCVAALNQGRGENVGGVWDIRPGANTWQARSIAAAAANPVGVGDAQYRYTREPAYVDTVPFGAFRREYLLGLGGYDESLLTNEDYELNQRILNSGGRIWLDPAIRCIYFARSSFASLAKQYLRYGMWKARMVRKHPASLKIRQILPPLFVAGLAGLTLAALWRSEALFLLLAGLVLYFSILVASSIPQAWRNRDPILLVGIPIAIAVMHFTWGTGFWAGLFRKNAANASSQ